MLISSIMAIISGLLMSVQGVFNTRVTEKAGVWFTTSIVQGVALVTCLLVLLFAKDANVEGLKAVNKFYLLGGVMGAGITYTVIMAMSKLGPSYAIMLILIAQMITGYCIEFFGLFGTPKVGFVWTKLMAVGIMIGGIVLFQWKK
ncbi:hypothetical protein CS063_02195 [Sporanaerobium hydrogeniformans]|uniref:Uncharacterized protein n=1 Tax=Sporanaerobium hydrogeniformans TaxID=3072179 RepID=A0AC61DGF4_9FIRM|nr:DMT family transporter [Sporanaerobium hydrogeniformans]PHV72309.1 hypothetical protein CS063_02195 [Sporanaerobium hydrogeniformans]